MYRKHQQQLKDMENEKDSLARVTNYPMVKDAWTKLSSMYQSGKESSRLFRLCGTVAEASTTMVLKASRPALEILPDLVSLESANETANEKLDVLEKTFPLIAMPTQEAVEAVKSYSSAKVAEAYEYGTDRFNTMAEKVQLNSVIKTADVMVDKYLPPVEPADGSTQAKPDADLEMELPTPAFTSLRMLSDKVKHRAYDRAMAKASTFNMRTTQAVSALTHTVNLIEVAARDIAIDEIFGDVKGKVNYLYTEITKEEESETLTKGSREERFILTARLLVKRARSNAAFVSKFTLQISDQTRTMFANSFKFVSTSSTEYYQQMTSFLQNLYQALYDAKDKHGVTMDLTRYMQMAAVYELVKYLRDNVTRYNPLTRGITAASHPTFSLPDDSDADSYPAGKPAAAVDTTFNSSPGQDSLLSSTRDSIDSATDSDDE